MSMNTPEFMQALHEGRIAEFERRQAVRRPGARGESYAGLRRLAASVRAHW